jgi:phosphoribosylaminoimidazole-succinocarboxamide synthase
MKSVTETNFSFPGQKNFYKGKVRDVYHINDDLLVMIATDRISAFDVVLPAGVPYKGQILNQIAAKFLDATAHLVPNWKLSLPDPMVMIGRRCDPFPVEMVIRGYLTGSSWRTYNSGARIICGVPVPNGLKEHDPFPHPIITPTTKAKSGHDMDISREEIINKGIVAEEDYLILENYTHLLYQKGAEMAHQKGLILVDTKYEFGKSNGKIYLIDEIHTPDSSRYFYLEGYEQRQAKGEPQKQLSKEFVREWLMKLGFSGQKDMPPPEMPEEFVMEITNRYIELYQVITGEKFVKISTDDLLQRIETNIRKYLEN